MTELPEMKSFYSQELQVSILFPELWNIETVSESQFRIFGLVESGFERYFDEYRCTMSYLLAEPESNESLDWFEVLIHESTAQIAREYNDYELIHEEHYQIADRPGYVHYYEWTEENFNLRLSQLQSLIRVDDSSFYLINAASLKPLDERYMPIFTAILDSTKILST